ncbi:hypothetical protein PS876_05263 [Pseudomonas fluorescens]|nr:hypothetical protein PS876_05263 [Pseudomonas fluorescens]
MNRQRVGGGQQRDHLVFDQRDRVETFLGQYHKADVDPSFLQPLEHLAVGAFVDMHLYAGMGGAVLLQYQRQQFDR